MAVAVTPADAATIKQSPVCKRADTHCVMFTDIDPIPIIWSYKFTPPTAGTALVSFHGQMQCTNVFSAAEVVDLEAQILNANGPVDFQGPGGSRISVRLPGDSTFVGVSQSINLASSRVFTLAQREHTFLFKISRLRMDPATSCIVFNGNFTVVFVP